MSFINLVSEDQAEPHLKQIYQQIRQSYGFLPNYMQALEQRVARSFPRGAVEYLRQHPVAGRMLNEYDWGGYLIWSLGPAHKVFIDGRADIYEYGGVLSDYFRMINVEPDTLFLLRKYGVKACLLKREAPLGTLLAALPGWEPVYTDELSVVFVHKMRSGVSGKRLSADRQR